MPAFLTILLAVLGLVILLGSTAVRRRKRLRRGQSRNAAEMEALLHRYMEGGWQTTRDRLVQDGEATSGRSAGWHAQQAIARFYLPVGLRPRHRDEPPVDQPHPDND
ncbi:MAG: hypothetical protein ACR2PL_26825 [Dehalococcoidia bacterium]